MIGLGFRHPGKNPLKKPSNEPTPNLIQFCVVMPVMINNFVAFKASKDPWAISNEFAHF